MAEQNTHIGDITMTLIPARVVVHNAPDQAAIALELLAGAAPDRLWVTRDRIYIGEDQAGREICYKVTGWDPVNGSLTVTKLPDPSDGDQP